MKRSKLFLLVFVLALVGGAQAQDTVVLLSEDFEGLPLGPNVDEGTAGDAVWTDIPPAGWINDASGVPGIEDPGTDGVTEWAGWGFADKEWWITTAGGQNRSEFELGQGTVAIADPDEWDDAGHPKDYPADTYDVWLSTAPIDLATSRAGTVQLKFDSSWRPEFDDDYHQSAKLMVSFDGGEPIDLFVWVSDSASPNYKDYATNETVTIDIDNPAGATNMVLTFGLFDAGNDWWWAIDNIVVTAEFSAIYAYHPYPANGAVEVPVKTALSWTPGQYVGGSSPQHKVILSDDLSAVEGGTAVVSTQDANSFDATGLLDFNTTYYWRIDEANGVSGWDEGNIWSFTTEQFAYPVETIIATSNAASDAGAGPERTIDGSGLNEMDEHSTVSTDMWLGIGGGADPVYIQYEFDSVYKMHEMLVWNYNVQFEQVLGFGFKEVTVEYSSDGVEWTVLGDVEFAQAAAKADYTANTVVDFQGAPAKFVRLTANSGYGVLPQYGLSEVRFMSIPAQPRDPQPADGEADVDVNTTLSWRAGREAVTHDVYLGTDPEALALVDSAGQASYVPSDLLFAGTYYWKVDEVNEADEVSVWPGALWSFTTQEFALIDGFEDYDDEDNTIFDVWIDGLTNGTGSVVGYFNAPFAEQRIVNSGRQSMPLEYDNSAAPFYSEAERDLGSMDWTTNGAESIRMFIMGQADNAPEPLYVAVEDTTGSVAVATNPDAEVATGSEWAEWVIPFTDLAGVNLGRVAIVYVGVGDRDNPTAGGTGLVYIDDIGYGNSALPAAQ